MEIVVMVPPIRKQVVSTEVAVDEGRRVPGASGDVLKVVKNLPAWPAPRSAPARSSSGARPRRIHASTSRASACLGSTTTVACARWCTRTWCSRSTSRRVDTARPTEAGWAGWSPSTRPLEDTGYHGSVAADVYDVAGAVRASVDDRFHIAVAARKSWLDALLPVFTSNNTSNLFPIPHYADGQLRVSYRLDPHTSVEVGGIISSDSTSQSTPNADPTQRETQTTSLLWDRVYARYRHETEAGGVVTITPSFGSDISSLVSAFGATPTELDVSALVLGLRAGWRGKAMPGLILSVGLDTEAIDSAVHRAGSVTQPPREGDVFVFGQAPSAQISADDFRVTSTTAAPYIEGDVALDDDHLTSCLDFASPRYVLATTRRTPVGHTPSVGVFTSEPLVGAAGGRHIRHRATRTRQGRHCRYHQLPDPVDLSAAFGNPLFTSAQADHYLAGGRFVLLEGLSMESTGFYTTSSGLAARDPSPSPPLAGALQQTGSGRSYGVQLLVRKDLTAHLFGWLSYTLTPKRATGLCTGARWRLFDYDQTHVLTALASYAFGNGFEAGRAFGRPRAILGRRSWARTSTPGRIRTNPSSGSRTPPSVSRRSCPSTYASLKALRPWQLAGPRAASPSTDKHPARGISDVQNVTDQQNPEEIVYTPNFSQKAYITGLPILPSLGARLAW